MLTHINHQLVMIHVFIVIDSILSLFSTHISADNIV
jgi:hypothetical protein